MTHRFTSNAPILKSRMLLFLYFFLPGGSLLAQTMPDSLQPWVKHGRICVSKKDPHFLAYEDGEPFFWLGDTGWELFHLLDRKEISSYLKTRKAQGFNVIQTVAVSEFDGLTSPNAYGALPFAEHDPLHPAVATNPGREYGYWDHVDYSIQEAERQGLFIALLPCWGEYVIPRVGKPFFTKTSQAYAYGNFLGRRYRAQKNIIWILGGDRHPDEVPGGIDLWRAMAKGIADGTNGIDHWEGVTDYSTTFMTYHCFASSSKWFQNDAWLDMDMWGSYHDNFGSTRAYEQVLQDDSLPVIKPTLNGEAAYEDMPVNWLADNAAFTAYDVRQIAYWSVFAGACGHTYGNNSVWQFYDTGRIPKVFARVPWQQALNAPGGRQLVFLRNLILSRPVNGRKPANSLITDGEGAGSDHCVATLGLHYAFVYIPTGHPVTVQLNKIGSRAVKAWWYDPRNGRTTFVGEFPSDRALRFSPPGISRDLAWLKTGRGCDWVLVLDDGDANLGRPGTTYPSLPTRFP